MYKLPLMVALPHEAATTSVFGLSAWLASTESIENLSNKDTVNIIIDLLTSSLAAAKIDDSSFPLVTEFWAWSISTQVKIQSPINLQPSLHVSAPCVAYSLCW